MSEKELTRKQIELTMIHEKLAEWINKYMELQESKGFIPNKYDKELIEYFIPNFNLYNAFLQKIKKFHPV